MKKWSEASMTFAIEDVKKGMSVRKASEKHGVPKSSLSDRLTSRVESGTVWGKESQLSREDERELINIATKRAEMGVGFTKSTFLRFVGVFASEKGLAFKNGVPSDMWWRRLKQRHENFSLRTAEATASSRHNAMTRERIFQYFDNLKCTYDKYGLHNYPSRIWNMDETGVTLAHKPPKVLAAKGAKTVHGRASISRETITVVACGNASGQNIPPHFIIPGKTSKKLHGFDTDTSLQEGWPLYGAKFSVSDSGWTKDGICQLWFQTTFLPNIGNDQPQILICDGHRSHNNVELLKLARENDILLGELPSHTSHWTQPFDRSVFKSLKTNWNVYVDNFVKETGVHPTHSNFFRIFGRAWAASITQANITSGFRATGIFPFNPKAIPDNAYNPSETSTDLAGSLVATPESSVAALLPTVANNASPARLSEDIVPTSYDPVMTSVVLERPERPENDSLTSINISIPLSENDNNLDVLDVFDLPVSLGVFGNLVCYTTNMPDSEVHIPTSCSSFNETQVSSVSDEKAIEVIESTLSPEQLSKYCAAYLSGTEMENKLYQTWKMYKQKSTKKQFSTATQNANEMFPLQKDASVGQRKRKTHSSDSFFVITADEVFNEKLAKQEENKRKLVEKEKRKQDREIKKTMKQLQTQCKSKTKKT